MVNRTNRLCLIGRLNISMDDLYEECVTANSLLEHLTQEKETWQSKGTTERWMEILQAAGLPNPSCCILVSIPSSTGFVERTFSFMKNKWTDLRNKCSTELIKVELIVSLSYELSCSEFYSVALLTTPHCSKSSEEIQMEKVVVSPHNVALSC